MSKKKARRKPAAPRAPRGAQWYEVFEQPIVEKVLASAMQYVLSQGVSSRSDFRKRFCTQYKCAVSQDVFNSWIVDLHMDELFQKAKIIQVPLPSRGVPLSPPKMAEESPPFPSEAVDPVPEDINEDPNFQPPARTAVWTPATPLEERPRHELPPYAPVTAVQ